MYYLCYIVAVFSQTEELVYWSGFGWHRPFWKGTKEQRRKYKVETFKAVGFIVGMVPPIVVGLYVTLYISCYRNQGTIIGNMFGAGGADF